MPSVIKYSGLKKNFLFLSFFLVLLSFSVFSHSVIVSAESYEEPAITLDVSASLSDSVGGEVSDYSFSISVLEDMEVPEGETGFLSISVNFCGQGESQESESPDFSSVSLDSVLGLTGAEIPEVPEDSMSEPSPKNNKEIWFTNSLSQGDEISFTLKNGVNPYSSGSFRLMVEAGHMPLMGGDRARELYGVNDSAFYLGDVVVGKIVSPESEGVSGVGVELHTEDFSQSYHWGTSQDGSFSFSSVEPGDYILEVWLSPGSSYIAPEDPVTVSFSGGVEDMGDIVLSVPDKFVSGFVKFEDGTIPENVSVQANLTGGRGWMSANVDSNGAYELGLTEGSWELMLSPVWGENGQLPTNWAYMQPPRNVSFENSNEVVVNFTPIKASATVTGQIVYPDGSPACMGGIDVRSVEGMGSGGGLEMDGSFSVSVPEGKYLLGVHLEDQLFTIPRMDSFKVSDGQTLDLGKVRLIEKKEHIQGNVKGPEGEPVVGLEVEAWNSTSGGWTHDTTDSEGQFDLLVSTGVWEVMPREGNGFVYLNGSPTRVNLSAEEVVTGVSFRMTIADALITGFLKDADGQVLSEMFAWAQAMEGTGDNPMPGPGGEVSNGSFSIAVPAGTWTVSVHTPSGSDYSPVAGKTVSVSSGETVSADIILKKNDAHIQGRVLNEAGDPVTGLQVEVFGHSTSGGMKNSFVDSSNGHYSLDVVGGSSWFLGVFVPPNSGYVMVPPDDMKMTVLSGETKTRDFTLLKANSSVKVTVLDPNGNPMDGVFAFVDSFAGKDMDFDEKKADKGVHTGDIVDSSGQVTLQVPAGTYGVGSGAPSSTGYMNPEIQRVTLSEGETKSVTLRYKASDALISGTVYLDGEVSPGFVWAWSEEGGHAETMTFSGNYELNVTKGDIWHVGADYRGDDGTFYRSDEYIVRVSTSQVSQKIEMSEADYRIPSAMSRSFTATNPATITLENGAEISIPAGAIAQSGTVTIIATPTEQLAKQQNARPLAFGYDLQALADGSPVASNFSQDVTITFPYTEGMLEELGVSASQVGASYFDTSSSLWQGITSFIIDTDSQEITFTVNHFTQFALTTGQADTTPPDDPTSITAEADDSEVSLSWINPSQADFDHINIYRSTAEGSLGSLVYSTSSSETTSFTDENLENETTYYYTLRSVDEGGNESSNNVQVSATPESVLPATGVSLSEAWQIWKQCLIKFFQEWFV